ncbi:MAG TPA: 6-phosphogluconate dehydrogenase, partial [Phycicoccus sp.]
KANVRKAMPIFDALRPEGPRDEGFVHAGKVGAGHYTKMVHNGIEYGLMHAYAEGYELLVKKDIVENVPGAFKAWSRGTVVRSWLLDLMVAALEEKPTLEDVSDYTSDSGEGRWTVEEAIELSVPMPVISASLFARFASRQQTSPAMQAVAALRGQFGGHEVMSVAEGERLRAEASAGPVTAGASQRAVASKEKPPRSPRQAAAKARKGAAAGPSSPATDSTDPESRGSTRKRATKKG